MYEKKIHHENDLLKGKNDWCMCVIVKMIKVLFRDKSDFLFNISLFIGW